MMRAGRHAPRMPTEAQVSWNQPMDDIEKIKDRASKALFPLQPAGPSTTWDEKFWLTASRTNAGRNLPPYYLVYFLLVDLMKFPRTGMEEKVAWSVPVEFNGRGYSIEHRKFGLGIFATDHPRAESDAEEIAKRIRKALRVSEPFFDWYASEAAKQSHLNIINRSQDLFERYEYFLGLYEAKRLEAGARKDDVVKTPMGSGTSYHFPAGPLRREAKWLALSAIESFFSWTEHVLTLIPILFGSVQTGDEVAALANAEWEQKFKASLDITDKTTKQFYDELALIRRQLRNVVAHGAFGKQGEAMQFHSAAGAVPMLLPHKHKGTFKFGKGIDFVDHQAIERLAAFVTHLWSGTRAPAFVYIQKWELPLILTFAQNGDYQKAMSSVADMEAFASHLGAVMDNYANMDF